jgi:hypothetical protein
VDEHLLLVPLPGTAGAALSLPVHRDLVFARYAGWRTPAG